MTGASGFTLDWRKPDSCPNAATCVEIALIPAEERWRDPYQLTAIPTVVELDDGTFVVSGDTRSGPVTLRYTRAEWKAFLASALDGQYGTPNVASSTTRT